MAADVGVSRPLKQGLILFGVDFTINEGDAVALLGANGSGKSPCLNAVSGFVRPWSGSVRLNRAR